MNLTLKEVILLEIASIPGILTGYFLVRIQLQMYKDRVHTFLWKRSFLGYFLFLKAKTKCHITNSNLACLSCIGEYWPSVIFCTNLTVLIPYNVSSGHYSPVLPSHSVWKRLFLSQDWWVISLHCVVWLWLDNSLNIEKGKDVTANKLFFRSIHIIHILKYKGDYSFSC